MYAPGTILSGHEVTSLMLSEVLHDIEVNERMVMKRRYMNSQTEFMKTVPIEYKNVQCYIFDSAAEGTATMGLHSDCDVLWCNNNYNVIQNKSEWKEGAFNLLLLNDDTPTGYCLLQKVGRDIQTFESIVFNEKKELLSYVKSVPQHIYPDNTRDEQFGPEIPAPQAADPAKVKTINIYACKSWPESATTWLNEKSKGEWPTDEMKRYCQTTKCFVVPVSSKDCNNQGFEWRISTALAERYIIFNLTITQIKCYVLIKMLLKSYLNPHEEGCLSRYMCKTVLFHCMEETKACFWQENNLLGCLLYCFEKLNAFIASENCPHFFIRGNNLMAGQLPPATKLKLLAKVRNLTDSSALIKLLLGVSTDNLNTRLRYKLGSAEVRNINIPSSVQIEGEISGQLLVNFASHLYTLHQDLLKRIKPPFLFHFLSHFCCYATNARPGNSIQHTVGNQIAAFLCTSIGSAIASANIGMNKTISMEAMFWFSLGMHSDALSSRLKFASAFFCAGQMDRTKTILGDIEKQYRDANQYCVCHGGHMGQKWPVNFQEDKIDIHDFAGVCIRFLPYERDCVPRELLYEMFRSSQAEKRDRNHLYSWMDWAVVDPMYCLYFLQYKVYGHLKEHALQLGSLLNLLYIVHCIPYPGHRETALNLLGQCLEQEKQYSDAISCYLKSLEVQDSNNVARWHICKLLAKLVAQKIRVRNAAGVSLWEAGPAISTEIEKYENPRQRKTQMHVLTKMFEYKKRHIP